jgi:uncharacterized protein YkwD
MRRRLLTALTALALALAAAGCVVVETEAPSGAPGGAPAPPVGEPPEPTEEGVRQMERTVFDRVNAERVERGLPAVEWDDQLAELAREWSREMAAANDLRHQDLRAVLDGGRVSGYTALGENIFTSTGQVPAGTLHAGWMRSDDHRGNVLEPAWDRLGVGVHCAPDGSVWAAQEFGQTAGADRPQPTQDVPPEQPIVHPEDDGPSCAG